MTQCDFRLLHGPLHTLDDVLYLLGGGISLTGSCSAQNAWIYNESLVPGKRTFLPKIPIWIL